MAERIEDVIKEKYPDMPGEQMSFLVSTLNEKIGKAWGTVDERVEAIVGKKRPTGKQTGEWITEELTAYKTKAETVESMLKGDIEKANAKSAELEKQLKEGKFDDAAKTKITELETALNDEKTKNKGFETKYATEKEQWQKDLEKKDSLNSKYRVESQFDSVIAQITRKDESILSKTMQQLAIKEAKERGFSTPNEFVKDPITGVETLVFRDENKNILMSKENPAKPMEALELLKGFGLSEIIDPGRQQTGGGTKPPMGNGGNGATVNVDTKGAKTKVEADEIFNSAWFSQGKATSDKEYLPELTKMRETLPKDLPFR